MACSPAVAVAAQAYVGEGPGNLRPPQAATYLAPAALSNGVSEVGQLALTRIAGHVYYLTATVKRTGSAGGWDAMSGTWDEAARTFVKNNDVDHLNGAGDEFSCTVSPDLLTVALDTSAGAVFATRAAPSGSFGPAAPILGVPPGYIDPVLCNTQGLLSLSYIQGNDLMIANLSDGQISHARVLVASVGRRLHSPSTVADEAGEARVVVFSRDEGNGSSTAWANSSMRAPADGTQSFRMLDRSSWLANPAATAGTLRYAEAGATYGAPVELSVLMAHSTCISTAGGADNLDVCAFAPVQTAPTALPYVGMFLLGNLSVAPITVPGLLGSPLGLDPAGLVTLPFGMFDKTTGIMRFKAATPALPNLRLFLVPVAIDHNNQPPRVFLGNTAPMVAENSHWCGKTVQDTGTGNLCPAGFVKVRNFRIAVAGAGVGTVVHGGWYCIKCDITDPLCTPKLCLIKLYRDRTYTQNGTTWTEFKYDCACQ